MMILHSALILSLKNPVRQCLRGAEIRMLLICASPRPFGGTEGVLRS